MATWFAGPCARRGIPAVSLRELLPEALFLGCRDLVVSGCSADSRRVEPGEVFVAIRGRRHDGHDYLERALERGAAGVVVERFVAEAGHPQVVVADSRSAFAKTCQALAGSPSRSTRVIAIAGSHGTTVAGIALRSILEAAGLSVAMIGPAAWARPGEAPRFGPITPRPHGLAAMLAEAVDQRHDIVILAATSEALAERYLDGVECHQVLLTNLSDDRDADATQRFRAGMGRLARSVVTDGAVVLSGDDHELAPLAGSNLRARSRSFGFDPTCDLWGRVERLTTYGTALRLGDAEGSRLVRLHLIGRENARLGLAAAAAARDLGASFEAVVAGLEGLGQVPGRLERTETDDGAFVFIDEARTAADLARALRAVREVLPPDARVHCVVGAQGGSNLADRLALARAAELGADQVFLAPANPRGEESRDLIGDLQAGLKRPDQAFAFDDRRAAIESALAEAAPGDAVLIAGRGRERVLVGLDTFRTDTDHDLVHRFLGQEVSGAWQRTA